MTKVHFNDEIAAHYDATTAERSRPEVLDRTVDVLEELAGGGAALELGVGTGRVALPLSERGVAVHGIDNSEPMLERLREKPGSERVGLVLGDMASTRVDRSFRLVYMVFNTITNLTTQDEQVACFRNAARHLEPGGCFVLEVFVPDLRRLPLGERIRAFDVGNEHLGFDEYHDFAAQLLTSHHFWLGGQSARTFSAPFRYVWPSELDLMARLADLRLRERWAGWDRAPFTDESPAHVSVWEKRA